VGGFGRRHSRLLAECNLLHPGHPQRNATAVSVDPKSALKARAASTTEEVLGGEAGERCYTLVGKGGQPVRPESKFYALSCGRDHQRARVRYGSVRGADGES